MSDIPQIDVRDLPDPLPATLLVLDVREPDEWDDGHIAGARHVPMMTVPAEVDSLRQSDHVLVVCQVGARSARVTAFLQAHGVVASNLAGGMVAWARAGRMIVTGNGPVASDDASANGD
jgi:rhodanese-related sulfurtransferase